MFSILHLVSGYHSSANVNSGSQFTLCHTGRVAIEFDVISQGDSLCLHAMNIHRPVAFVKDCHLTSLPNGVHYGCRSVPSCDGARLYLSRLIELKRDGLWPAKDG